MHEIPIGIKMQFYDVDRDVMINRELVENWFKYVMIQMGWDAEITIQLRVGVYMNECLRGTYGLWKGLDGIFCHLYNAY